LGGLFYIFTSWDIIIGMRDDNWLAENMYQIWEDHFSDVPRKNLVIIRFSKRSSRQLGAISWLKNKTKKIAKLVADHGPADDPKVTLIVITSFFKDPLIPDYVVRGTIAHELCHYAHGFSSPLKQVYEHPHKGGVIRKEMIQRGLGEVYKESKKWLKLNWRNYLLSIRKGARTF